MLDFIVEMVGEVFVGVFFEVFAGMFSTGDRRGTEMLSVVPRLPTGAGVLSAKGGR
jgi:hypothetical protein